MKIEIFLLKIVKKFNQNIIYCYAITWKTFFD